MDKSYLINTIFQILTRTFNLYSDTPEKVKVLKMAPTGVVAVSINGTTINTALGIPTTRGNNIPNLSDKMRYKLRLMYSELKEVIINAVYLISGFIRFIVGFVKYFCISLDILFARLTVM